MTVTTQPLSGAVPCGFPHTIDLNFTLVAVSCHGYPAKFSPYPLIFNPRLGLRELAPTYRILNYLDHLASVD